MTKINLWRLKKTGKKQERIDLLKNAETEERLELYKPLDEADLEYVISLYSLLVEKHPQTKEASLARERIENIRNLMSERQEEAQKEEPASVIENDADKTLPKSFESHDDVKIAEEGKIEEVTGKDTELLVFEGQLEDLGVVFNRPGTFKLIRGNERICIIKAGELNLNPFIYSMVRVKGKRLNAPNWRIPVIQAVEIQSTEKRKAN